jgi:peroxiredoxin Q/BCP
MSDPFSVSLQAGDTAPAFTAVSDKGERISLADFEGRFVVLYFYPKDDTPGCTKEACAFRDSSAELAKLGAVVLGVSIDSVKAHGKFIKKFNLPFPLLADEDRAIINAYGVWGEKIFMGRKYQGTHRVTFLIGPDGRIADLWTKIKPEQHVSEVLVALRAKALKV